MVTEKISVAALPEESFGQCPVDFVLTGGDYDFLLLNLLDGLKAGAGYSLAEERLEPGIY